MVAFVSSNFKIREEALDGFRKCDAVAVQFVPLEVIFKVRRLKAMLIDNSSFYDGFLWSAEVETGPVTARCPPTLLRQGLHRTLRILLLLAIRVRTLPNRPGLQPLLQHVRTAAFRTLFRNRLAPRNKVAFG